MQSDESHVDTRPGKVLESKYRSGLFHLCRRYFHAGLPIVPNPNLIVAALSAFLDIFLAFYPAVILWNLQMPTRRKALLLIAFALGSW